VGGSEPLANVYIAIVVYGCNALSIPT